MKRITVTVATGLLIAGFACLGTPHAQSEPQAAAAAKITLKGLAAQVATLQSTVSSLQSAENSLQVELQNFAVVDFDGTLVRGSSSVVSATRLGPGGYQVTFNKDLTFCAYQATIGDTADGSTSPGEVWVATRSGNSDAVFVKTTDSAGIGSDRPFHLYVICPSADPM